MARVTCPVLCIFCRTEHPHGIRCLMACEADLDRSIVKAEAAIRRTREIVTTIRHEAATHCVPPQTFARSVTWP